MSRAWLGGFGCHLPGGASPAIRAAEEVARETPVDIRPRAVKGTGVIDRSARSTVISPECRG